MLIENYIRSPWGLVNEKENDNIHNERTSTNV